jgi:predicted RNA-binding Zn-ribbon protein involved in translation (DUF1610 family)
MSNQVYQVSCTKCNGMFVTENVQTAPLLRCPHCRREAPPRQFNYVHNNQPFEVAQEGLPALFSDIEHAEDEENNDIHESDPELETFKIKGKWVHFDCPHCTWPLRIRSSDASSSLMDCGHCGLELIPPDVETGMAAQLTRSSSKQLDQITKADIRSVRLGSGKSGGDSIVAKGKKTPQESQFDIETTNGGETEILSLKSSPKKSPKFKPQPKPEKPAIVRPLRDEQLGRSFVPFDDLTIRGGLDFEQDEAMMAELERQKRLNHARVFRYVMISAIVVLAAVALLLKLSMSEDLEAQAANRKEHQSRMAKAAAAQSRIDDLFNTAKRLAASEDWHAFLPTLRQRSRVEPIMEAYYSANEHIPQELVSYEPPISIDINGFKYEQMTVKTAGGRTLIAGFQHDPEGVTFDWEVFVDIAKYEWDKFENEHPLEPVSLRTVLMRISADDTYYRDADFSREEGLAIRIWLRDRADSYVAVVPKDSPLGQQIAYHSKWDVGKLLIAELSYPPADQTTLTDRLLIHRIVQDRWLVNPVK